MPKERQRILLSRLQSAHDSTVTSITFDRLRDNFRGLISTLYLDGETVAIRLGGEAKAIYFLFIFLLPFFDGDIQEIIEARKTEIEASLKPLELETEQIKKIIKEALF